MLFKSYQRQLAISGIPGEALVCLRGYFTIGQTAISSFANEFLKLRNALALAITADTCKNFLKHLDAIGDGNARQFHGPRSAQQKAHNVFRRTRSVGADDGNFLSDVSPAFAYPVETCRQRP